MSGAPEHLTKHLKAHGQEHLLAAWEQLSASQKKDLEEQIQRIDMAHLRFLYADRDRAFQLPPLDRVRPIAMQPLDPADASLRAQGEEALRRGEVAVLLVAGGQGSRLGFEHPKGMYPIGPVTDRSLFQIHAEKVLALKRRYGRPIPFLVMTSPATHDETIDFFESRNHFGLPAENVTFFEQGMMPALDLATGKLLMEAPHRLFMSPNGHGGTISALQEHGILKELRHKGIRHLFYFQVDNPLVNIADPIFLGHHLKQRAEISSKAIPKESPTDRLGNLVELDGKCLIIEYSDLPDAMARLTDEQGRLRFRAGSPAIHWFDLNFLDRVTQDQMGLPFHIARKKVPHWDPSGQMIQPAKENALKFEKFIFDCLPLAERWTVVETSIKREFAPLKNADGADSPQAVKTALSNEAVGILAQLEFKAPIDEKGNALYAIELSPLWADNPLELKSRLGDDGAIIGPTVLAP